MWFGLDRRSAAGAGRLSRHAYPHGSITLVASFNILDKAVVADSWPQ